MKRRNIIILSMMLALLTMGAVGASDNSTSDTLFAGDDVNVEPEIHFGSYHEEFYVSDNPSLWVEFLDEDISGTLCLRIDDVELANKTASHGCVSFKVDEFFNDLQYNTPYNLSIIYSGDMKYKSWNTTDEFTLNYIKFDSLTDLSVDVQQWACVELPEDAEGEVSLYFDDALYDSVSVENGSAYIWLKDLEYGIHTYEFRYGGDRKYLPQNKSGIADVSYRLDVGLNDGETFLWGDEITLEIYTPAVCDEITLNQNGAIKRISLDENGYAKYVLSDLNYGKNTLVFNYTGDFRHPTRLITRTVQVIENITCPSEIGYSSGEGISVRMPEDAKGSILIFENNTKIASSKLVNGRAKIDLSMLDLTHHKINVKYTADDYNFTQNAFNFNVVPYINCTKSIKIDEANYISIHLPEDADGYFQVEYEGKIIGNESIENSTARIPLNLDKLGEGQTIIASYASAKYGNYTKSLEINVRNQPREGKLILNLPEVLVFDSASTLYFDLADHATGTLDITMAGNRFKIIVKDGYASISCDDLVRDLEFGNYTLKASYSGDEYYCPISNQTEVCVSFISIRVPETVEIGRNDQIVIRQSEDSYAPVELYIDGSYVKKSVPLEDEDYISIIDLSDLDFGVYYNVELRYPGTDRYSEFTGKYSFEVIYAVEIIVDECAYGSDAKILIRCYGDINGEGLFHINGEDYTVKLAKGFGEVAIPNLDIAKYEVTFTYDGDSTYPKRTVTDEIEVIPEIHFEDGYHISDDMNVSLTLPGDAMGNLCVIITGTDSSIALNKTAPLINGTAIISVNELKLGRYNIKSHYDGSDYEVGQVDCEISVNINVVAENLGLGNDNTVGIEMPKDANGTITVIIYGEELISNETYEPDNGKVSLSLKGYPPYDYYVNVIYNGSDYGYYSQYVYLNVLKDIPSINISLPDEIIAKDISTLTFTLPGDASGEVWVEIGEEYFYGEVHNGKASVNVTCPINGIRFISYGYSGDEKYESISDNAYITVLKAFTIKAKDMKIYYGDEAYFKATVYDSNKKPVIGLYVDFYIGSKFIKSAKTNRKGVAKLKITNAPNVYKITVKCRGAVESRKLSVNEVLFLKTVKVKKSSNKLVLKATLKKGRTALKNKKVTFKFNGKKYKTKTNSKGIAKVKITKSVLKKLKSGQKIKYQVTYIKDTVKKYARVT